ncbi:hypothetical protein P280DRAFT_471128 [Massarina eburnea CBS 473.64]|uniref:Uncharacterized protein n=1 Tax=Massarina eburnea CBS 473.64 TaxID=1395130 RepID=A0A6A6RTK9_9PLEO|nr:hypothetical protein P280DRAFT_471128 [Massarina eburnea CBS 473.64]
MHAENTPAIPSTVKNETTKSTHNPLRSAVSDLAEPIIIEDNIDASDDTIKAYFDAEDNIGLDYQSSSLTNTRTVRTTTPGTPEPRQTNQMSIQDAFAKTPPIKNKRPAGNEPNKAAGVRLSVLPMKGQKMLGKWVKRYETAKEKEEAETNPTAERRRRKKNSRCGVGGRTKEREREGRVEEEVA